MNVRQNSKPETAMVLLADQYVPNSNARERMPLLRDIRHGEDVQPLVLTLVQLSVRPLRPLLHPSEDGVDDGHSLSLLAAETGAHEEASTAEQIVHVDEIVRHHAPAVRRAEHRRELKLVAGEIRSVTRYAVKLVFLGLVSYLYHPITVACIQRRGMGNALLNNWQTKYKQSTSVV